MYQPCENSLIRGIVNEENCVVSLIHPKPDVLTVQLLRSSTLMPTFTSPAHTLTQASWALLLYYDCFFFFSCLEIIDTSGRVDFYEKSIDWIKFAVKTIMLTESVCQLSDPHSPKIERFFLQCPPSHERVEWAFHLSLKLLIQFLLKLRYPNIVVRWQKQRR
mgnify:CR=1 FL=1|jgi:hypothetical protein